MSELVKTMLPEEDDGSDIQEIPLPNVKNNVLAKVIEFCKHHKTDPMNDIEKVSGALSSVCLFVCVCVSLPLSLSLSLFPKPEGRLFLHFGCTQFTASQECQHA